MITGFAFREPGVVKLLLNRVQYSGFIIPEADPSNRHVKAYQAAMQEQVGKRTRVFLVTKCRTLCSLVSQIRDFDHTNAIYAVFDSASELYAKTCVDVCDAESSSQPVWMYSKSTPTVLNRKLATNGVGLKPSDLTCLGMIPENPEDRVETDKPKAREHRDNFVPMKTLMLELLDSPHLASSRVQAMHLLALWLAGKFNLRSELRHGKRNLTGIGIHTAYSYVGKTTEYAMLDRLYAAGLREGLNFAKHEAQIMALKALPEFRLVTKALCLVTNKVPLTKACATVGVDLGTVNMIVGSLQPPVVKAVKWVRQEIAFPVYVLQKITAARQTTEFVEPKTKAATTRQRVAAGAYSLEQLLRSTRLIGPRDVWSMVKANTNSVVSTNIPKHRSTSGDRYRVAAGERYFIRFRSSRIALEGV